MTQLYAQPYDLSATGFYFESLEEYQKKAAANRNDYGDKVEEYEIQFIDGDDLDCSLFTALGVSQCNIGAYFKACEGWEKYEKINVILAVGECGHDFDMEKDGPSDFDIDVYEVNSMRELAEQFIDEGLFGGIPENFQHYLDYDAIARDLSMDYSETVINSTNFVYRCG